MAGPLPPLHPSLDLLESGYEVHVLADGVSSQRLTDRGEPPLPRPGRSAGMRGDRTNASRREGQMLASNARPLVINLPLARPSPSHPPPLAPPPSPPLCA
jgi:hypothetical protein